MAYAVALPVWIACHQAAYDLIFASASSSDSAALNVYDADDVLLVSYALDPEDSAVNETTGDLALVPATASVNAVATGTASYARIADDEGTDLIEMPCTAGNTAVAGECVLNTLSLISGGPVEAMTITIKAGTLLA